MKKVVMIAGLVLMVSLSSCSLLNKKVNKTEVQVKTKVSFRMKVNSPIVYVNGEEVTLDVPVKEIDGRTLVPLTFVTKYLGAKNTNYDPLTEEVTFSLER
jgi:hypothetical protein